MLLTSSACAANEPSMPSANSAAGTRRDLTCADLVFFIWISQLFEVVSFVIHTSTLTACRIVFGLQRVRRDPRRARRESAGPASARAHRNHSSQAGPRRAPLRDRSPAPAESPG